MRVDWSLVASVAVPVAVGAIVAVATRKEVKDEWYNSLQKPEWTPPKYLFGPVWTVLYVMMGIAFWRVYTAGLRTDALALFTVQLVLNAAWSILFFNAQSLTWALVDVTALLSTLVATTLTFYKIDHAAGYLMMPYLVWVAYATALTAAIYTKNPDKI